jgi:putative MATE family efflux protein
MKNNQILADPNIPRLLMKLSVPATIGMTVMALYNVVDTIFVSRGVGSLAIAGISIVFPIHLIMLALGQMIGMGTASLVSRSLGAGNVERARQAFGNALVSIAIVGVSITILSYLFMNQILALFGATTAILPYARQYLSIIVANTTGFMFIITSNNIIRSEGHAKVAMGLMMNSAIINIILDPIFIFALGMGIRGAAIATVIAQLTTAVRAVIFFQSGVSILHINTRYLKLDASILREVFAIGVSSFSRQIAGSIVVISINKSLALYGDDLYIAAYGVINRMMSFAIMPIFGIAQGMQPIAGFNFGAHRYKEVKKVIRLAMISATAFSSLSFLLFYFFPQPLFRIFTDDPELINRGIKSIKLLIMAGPIIGFQVIGAVVFQALGKALPSLLLSLSRQVLFLLPILVLLPRFIGMPGVWLSFPFSDLLASLLTAAMIIPLFRKHLANQPISQVKGFANDSDV